MLHQYLNPQGESHAVRIIQHKKAGHAMALIQQIFMECFDVRTPGVDAGDTEQTSPKSLLSRSLCCLGANLCNAALLINEMFFLNSSS